MRNLAGIFDKLSKSTSLLFSSKQFDELLNSISLSAICLDETGVVTYCNYAFCNLLNKDSFDLVGKKIDELLRSGNEEDDKNLGSQFISHPYIETTLTVDEQAITLAWNNVLVYNNNNEPIGINCIGNNITAIYQSNKEQQARNESLLPRIKELEEINAKLEESDRTKSIYLANLSHEVRTPINGIIGFAELLKEEFIDAEKRDKYIEIIQQTSTKLLYILNDILDTTKLSTGHIKLTYEEVNLNNLIANLSEIYRRDRENEELQFIVKNGLPDAYSKMILDETHIYQILNKLLHNAFTYTTKGSVEVGYELKENQIILFVKDTGVGMDQNQLQHLFDYNLDNKDSSQQNEGTYLDLAHIKSRLAMMEGQIKVESIVGEGTSIYVSLPHTIALPTKNKVKKERPVSALYSDKLVLLVEDDIFSISIMKEIFDSLNMPIIHTSSGLEAIKICEENMNINLVLMDIRLPDILGTEATTHIKKIRPDLPIIAQTANASSFDKELCLNAGCDSYITKPIHIGNLKKMLYRYLIEQY